MDGIAFDSLASSPCQRTESKRFRSFLIERTKA